MHIYKYNYLIVCISICYIICIWVLIMPSQCDKQMRSTSCTCVSLLPLRQPHTWWTLVSEILTLSSSWHPLSRTTRHNDFVPDSFSDSVGKFGWFFSVKKLFRYFISISCNLSYWSLYLIPLLGNSTAQVTSTGSLVFQNFKESMSGVYTCFLEYKPTVEEVVKNLQLKYVVYGKKGFWLYFNIS